MNTIKLTYGINIEISGNVTEDEKKKLDEEFFRILNFWIGDSDYIYDYLQEEVEGGVENVTASRKP